MALSCFGQETSELLSCLTKIEPLPSALYVEGRTLQYQDLHPGPKCTRSAQFCQGGLDRRGGGAEPHADGSNRTSENADIPVLPMSKIEHRWRKNMK